MTLKKFTALTLTCAISTQALAHSRWILPTHFNLSAEQGEWIMADITASNEIFNVDKAMGADLVKIITPDGETSRPSSTYKGLRKSVADYFIEESGTYKITNNSNAAYMPLIKLTETVKGYGLIKQNSVVNCQQVPKKYKPLTVTQE